MQMFITNSSRLKEKETGSKKKNIVFFFLFYCLFLPGLVAQTNNPSITIVNNTGYQISGAYIIPTESASENWGSNRLGIDQKISNGQSFQLRLPNTLNAENRYNIMLTDSNGKQYTKKNVSVSANSRIVFTKDDDESIISTQTSSIIGEDDEVTFLGGIRIGYNFTRVYGKEVSTDLKPGFQIGLFGERFFSNLPEFSWANGLLFTTQGCQGSASFLGKTLGENESVKMNLNYLQYQSNLQLKTDWGFTNLYGRIGLYVGCVVGGKLKVEESGGVSKTEKINFGASKDMRRWDFGWCVGGGLQFGYYQVTQIGFDFVNGFVNLIPEGKHKLTNTGGAITITFLF